MHETGIERPLEACEGAVCGGVQLDESGFAG